jgi:hypothetical protein
MREVHIIIGPLARAVTRRIVSEILPGIVAELARERAEVVAVRIVPADGPDRGPGPAGGGIDVREHPSK